MDIVHLFNKGGLVMYPLVLCSLIVFAIFFERIKVYRQAKSDVDGLRQSIKATRTGSMADLLSACQKDQGVASKVLCEAMEQGGSAEIQQEIIEGACSIEVSHLRQYLNYLDTIVTLSPLLGLLGTVVGMIGSFSVLSISEGEPFAITGGVGEALVATATGLCVAIIALVVHTYLAQYLDNLVSEMEELGSAYMTMLRGKQHEN